MSCYCIAALAKTSIPSSEEWLSQVTLALYFWVYTFGLFSQHFCGGDLWGLTVKPAAWSKTFVNIGMDIACMDSIKPLLLDSLHSMGTCPGAALFLSWKKCLVLIWLRAVTCLNIGTYLGSLLCRTGLPMILQAVMLNWFSEACTVKQLSRIWNYL